MMEQENGVIIMDDHNWFCPLIKFDCNPRCVCYKPEGTKTVKIFNCRGGTDECDITTPEHCTYFGIKNNEKY